MIKIHNTYAELADIRPAKQPPKETKLQIAQRIKERENQIKNLKILQEEHSKAKINPNLVADPKIPESHIDIMDKIYSAQEMKLSLKIKK